ncbi:DMT family transporter [Jannaschia seohaensis]|uniref:Drug/metabolite transporter (DMT)-like permease n=1 Tax=Jannaschia seohaensis TaxID=475081 RepID=A0A2Y9C231_9RHOB|nr:DMT family transporter [Jannaschia seohaensis]PWJ16128.1 drug/metabolite transporter (DMT)-like permease [Jannaschia seohaensis]SSA49002.1 Permease of the drug/metabolite transporter (DMT) superfamily [Jannaschia seohaensis]
MPDRSSPLSGIALALLSFALFATHDVAVKMLGGGYAVFQIVFFSVLLTFPMVTFMLLRDPHAGTLRPVHPWWTALRTLSAVITGLSAFYAFSVLPLAQVYAIIFASPLLITLLSIPILGEKVGLHRAGAVLVGLAGVLIVLGPTGLQLELGHLGALCAAFFGALSAVIMRKIGRDERTVVMMLYPMMGNFVVMGCLLPFVYRPIPLPDLGLWAMMAVFAFCGGICLIQAYRRADAVLVAPMQYSQIIWAALYGWLFFDESIQLQTAIGAAVIITSGLYIVLRESRGQSANSPVLRTRSRPETGTAFRVSPLLSDADREVPRAPKE